LIKDFFKKTNERYKAGGFTALIKAIPDETGRAFGNGAIIVLTSYVAASVCSSAALMVLVNVSLEGKKLRAPSVANVQLPKVDQPNYFAIRKGVVNRNIFNSEGEVPDELSPADTGPKKSDAKFSLEGPCDKSGLQLKLSGTIYMGDSESSLASVLDKGANITDTYKVGDEIIENPGVVIAKIERKRVILNNNGSKECLENSLDDSDTQIAEKPSREISPPPERPAPSNPVEVSEGGTVVLESAYVEEQLGEGFAKIIQAARLVPKSGSDGKPEGFKIFAIKPQSMLSKIGFKNGDIITKVNDTSMKRPDQGFALYQSLQDESDIVIQVLRGGTVPTNLSVQIK
jgi:type II secretion system protein C